MMFSWLICAINFKHMIQRIQSLYLFAVFVLSVVLFFVPLYTSETQNVDNGTHDFQYVSCASNSAYLVMNGMTGLLSLVIILLYKKRNLQLRLSGLSILFSCIFVGAVFYFSEDANASVLAKVHYDIGMYLPLIQLILTFRAMRAIRKDEALIRSADRLR